MNHEQFKELVDLYLDKEIDRVSLQRLQQAIAEDAERQREFEVACRLHQAMTAALNSEVAANEARSPVPRSRWLVSLAMAASFVLGGFLLSPVLKETSLFDSEAASLAIQPEAHPVAEASSTIYLSPSRRYMTQLSEANRVRNGSLTARLRLNGLSPDLEPPNVRLKKLEIERNHIYLVWSSHLRKTNLQSYTRMPNSVTAPGLPHAKAHAIAYFYRDHLVQVEKNFPASGPFQIDSSLASWVDAPFFTTRD